MIWTDSSKKFSKASTLQSQVTTLWICASWSRHFCKFNLQPDQTASRFCKCLSYKSEHLSTSRIETEVHLPLCLTKTTTTLTCCKLSNLLRMCSSSLCHPLLTMWLTAMPLCQSLRSNRKSKETILDFQESQDKRLNRATSNCRKLWRKTQKIAGALRH